jgi:hypothetical protein
MFFFVALASSPFSSCDSTSSGNSSPPPPPSPLTDSPSSETSSSSFFSSFFDADFPVSKSDFFSNGLEDFWVSHPDHAEFELATAVNGDAVDAAANPKV